MATATRKTADDDSVGTGAAVAQREPRTSTTAGLSPDRIKVAERNCATGSYQLAADICEAMFADDRVGKCLNRLFLATTLPLEFLLPGKDSKQSATDPICQALDYDFWKILPESKAKTVVRWLGLFGAALLHIDQWERDPETGRVLPVLSVWSCRHLGNDPTRGWQACIARSSSDMYGVWTAIEPGDGNWILILDGEGHRAPYSGRWRGLSRWWLLGKLYAPIDWASSSERHGQGREYVTNTVSASSNGLDGDLCEALPVPQRISLARDLANMGRNGVAVLPRGWSSEIVTDGANTYQTFAKQVEFANMAIDIGILGTNLTTEVQGGSYSAAMVHASIDAATMRGMLELLATSLRDQLLVHWARYNFGAGAVAPYPHWDTTPPEDQKATAEARKADADALKTYRDAGAQLNQKAWFEGRVELLKTAGEEFPEKPQAAAAPARPTAGSMARASAEDARAIQRGQRYVDSVAENAVRLAAKEFAPEIAGVLAAVEEAEDFDQARQAVRDFYADREPPMNLLKITEAALIMGQLAGRETIEQELELDEE